MNLKVQLPIGKTVRLTPELWTKVQELCVAVSNVKGRPINEATIIKLLLSQALADHNVASVSRSIID